MLFDKVIEHSFSKSKSRTFLWRNKIRKKAWSRERNFIFKYQSTYWLYLNMDIVDCADLIETLHSQLFLRWKVPVSFQLLLFLFKFKIHKLRLQSIINAKISSYCNGYIRFLVLSYVSLRNRLPFWIYFGFYQQSLINDIAS